MDTFAALALATEPPNIHLLERKPTGRKDPLISYVMWINILSQALYQLFVLCLVYYFGIILGFTKTSINMSASEALAKNNTLVFNVFVFCQIFNEVNCRKINMELNIFENIHKSSMFMLIFILTCVIQAGIIDLSILPIVPRFTQSRFLDWDQWVVALTLGFFGIPYSYVFRAFMNAVNVMSSMKFKYDKKAERQKKEMEKIKLGGLITKEDENSVEMKSLTEKNNKEK